MFDWGNGIQKKQAKAALVAVDDHAQDAVNLLFQKGGMMKPISTSTPTAAAAASTAAAGT